MRVVIVGAGSVGRSIARELLGHGHQVTVLDKDPQQMNVASVSEAEWILGDACDLHVLEEAQAQRCDVLVAATGDDKSNLVVSLLAKTEFGVPRTIARINDPKNEWMFDSAWGVDVPVSTPRIVTSLVEEAVAVGRFVRLFQFNRSRATMYELTLPEDADAVGTLVRDLAWPRGVVLAAVTRDKEPRSPQPDDVLEAADQLLFVVSAGATGVLDDLLTVLVGEPAAR